jgi:hypothetical protein
MDAWMHDLDLARALAQVEETLAAIAAVAAAPDSTLADLQRVAEQSTWALDACEALVWPYVADGVAFYQWRTTAHQCCAWEHPVLPLAQAYNALRAKYLDAHGELTTRHLALTGEE